MLKRIILFLRKNCIINCRPAIISDNGKADEYTLAVTDDTNIMKKFRDDGVPVLFVCESNEFAEGAEYVTDDISECDYEYFNMVYSRQKNIPLKILESPRCFVREMSVDDLPLLYKMYDDDAIRRYVEPLYEYEKEKEYTEDYIKNMYGFYGFGLWLAFDRNTGELAGRAGISIRNIDGKSCPELGYIISRKYRRKGYAYEICSHIVRYAFERLGIREIYLVTEKDNIPSVKTAEKLGFYRISEDDKYYIYIYSG